MSENGYSDHMQAKSEGGHSNNRQPYPVMARFCRKILVPIRGLAVLRRLRTDYGMGSTQSGTASDKPQSTRKSFLEKQHIDSASLEETV